MEILKLQIELSKMMTIMHKLQEGYLPPTLVPSTSLKKALLEVIDRLIEDNSPLRPIMDNDYLHKYYSIPATSTLKVDKTLIITLQIPLTEMRIPFSIYSVNNMGCQIKGNMEKGYTKLAEDQLPQYLAISNDNKWYVPLKEYQYQVCSSHFHGFCPFLNLMHNALSDLCIIKIHQDDMIGIKENCKIDIYPNARLPESVKMVTSGQYLITNPRAKVQVDCGEKGKSYVDIISQKLVSIPCGCRIVIGRLRTMTSTFNCNGTLHKVMIKYTVNMALASRFGQEDLIRFNPTRLQLPETSELKLPPLDRFVEEYHNLSATDQKLKITLDNWAQANTRQIKSNVRDRIEARDTKLGQQIKQMIGRSKSQVSLNWKDYIYMTGMGLTFIILAVYGYKLHTLGLINLLDQLPKTRAMQF
ncbi:MAG: hypothetical protein GY702_06320, partial [Desulfobulbaceae bacterium]|nr:hypothetical protein [Desulfobulbaceae bacterium]